MNETLHTKWGNARLNEGDYKITSRKEGHHGEKLHRLIFEEFYCEIPKGYVFHHKDENKLNNCIMNLSLVSKSEHHKLHNTYEKHPFSGLYGENSPRWGKKHSEETKQRISEKLKGRKMPEGFGLHRSKKCGSTGYFRVTKCQNSWRYQYQENGKNKAIVSVDIDKLKDKVLAKGLEWIEYDDKEVLA